MPDYYIAKDGKTTGPFSVSQLDDMVSTGMISRNNWALAKGETQWKPLRDYLPAQDEGHIPPVPSPNGPAAAPPLPATPAPGPVSTSTPSKARKRARGCGRIALIALFAAVGIAILIQAEKRIQRHRQEQEAAAQAAAEKERVLASKTDLIANADGLLEQADFFSALAILRRISKADPADVAIKDRIKEIQNLQVKAREATLFAEARKLPATEVDRLHEIYGELTRLAPENVLYRERGAHYSKEWRRIRKEKQAEERAAQARQAEEAIRKERIRKHFSDWDGSHRALTEIVKKSMNDPSSYDHVETVYWDKGDHLVVKTTFRGKNAFGGVVTNWVMAKVGLNGNVIEILSQGP